MPVAFTWADSTFARMRFPSRYSPRSRTALVTAASLLAPATLGAQSTATAITPSAISTAADRIFAAWDNTTGPGCAVGVSRDGRVVWQGGYGMADLNGDRPIRAHTVLESGSVAKQFLAAAVMLLVSDGKLSLDDDVRRWLPELPTYDRVITVRHLLTHTSGLREWSNLMEWQGWPRGTRVHTQGDVFRVITAQRALNYPVGDHYSYTNSGFLLARTLVERVSGTDFESFSQERIFRPLGLTSTSWRGDFRRIVPGLAQAYRRTPTGWRLDMPGDNVIGAGGLWTTVGDWLTWNEHLTRKTLGANVVDAMERRMTLTSGLPIAYALGLFVQEYRGTPEIAHSGSTAGYSTYLARYPKLDNLSIAVMCNAAGANATGYTRALVDALFPSLPRAASPDTVPTDHAMLASWRGVYEQNRWHDVMVLDTAGGQLRQGNTPVRMLRDGTVMVGGTRARLHVTADGRTRTLRTATSDGDSVVWTWRAATRWRPGASELTPLAGRYRNDEVGNTFTVELRGDQLMLVIRPGMEQPLTPSFRDAFEGASGNVWFTRDRGGKVTAMHFGESRVWNLVSPRVP